MLNLIQCLDRTLQFKVSENEPCTCSPSDFLNHYNFQTDIEEHISMLCKGGVTGAHEKMKEVGQRLYKNYCRGRLVIKPHLFWCSGHFFTSMPQRILQTLAKDLIVFIKGDRNYRRLLQDSNHWNPEMSLSKVNNLPCEFQHAVHVLFGIGSQLLCNAWHHSSLCMCAYTEISSHHWPACRLC